MSRDEIDNLRQNGTSDELGYRIPSGHELNRDGYMSTPGSVVSELPSARGRGRGERRRSAPTVEFGGSIASPPRGLGTGERRHVSPSRGPLMESPPHVMYRPPDHSEEITVPATDATN